jgi:hypothetical protein
MSSIFKKAAMLVLGGAVFVGSYTWDGQVAPIAGVTLIAPAEARVGRPLTPVSYAGVARRTTRRAVYTGAVVGAAARPVVVAAPTTVVVAAPTTQTCVDTVNADGSITRTCR